MSGSARAPAELRAGKRGAVAPAAAIAYAAFAWTFLGPRESFWDRMTATGAMLGSMALLVDSRLRSVRVRARDVAVGLTAAAGLYGVFRMGDRLARRVMPKGGEEIDEVYALRKLRPAGELTARLALVIGPSEELFWRGFLQSRLSERTGRWRGAGLSSLLYGGAHLVTANLTLTGAAAVAGTYWSALAAAGVSMPALIVSHVAWDVWIFLVAPTVPAQRAA